MLADHDECAHCSLTRDQHKAAESAGEVNHVFSTDGSLTQVMPKTSKTEPRGGQNVVIAPAPDLMLRKLLVELGVITQEQFEGLFTGTWTL